MLPPNLIFCFASSLFATASAIPAKRIRPLPTSNHVSPSTLSLPSLPTVLSVSNLTITAGRRPSCWPDEPDTDPRARYKPITDQEHCLRAVMDMLSEGPEREPVVWDSMRVWIYESCGLFLVPSIRLPIHRGTFSRKDIARCAERIGLKCVTEKYGYRGGILPVDVGVFQVAIAGEPAQPPWRERKKME